MYLCLFGVRSLMVYDVCHLCGLYHLSRKIFHFVSFRKIKKKIKNKLKKLLRLENPGHSWRKQGKIPGPCVLPCLPSAPLNPGGVWTQTSVLRQAGSLRMTPFSASSRVAHTSSNLVRSELSCMQQEFRGPRDHPCGSLRAIRGERGSPLAVHATDWKSGCLLAQGTAELMPASMGMHHWSQASSFFAIRMAQNHQVSEGKDRAFFFFKSYFKGQVPVFTGIWLQRERERDRGKKIIPA